MTGELGAQLTGLVDKQETTELGKVEVQSKIDEFKLTAPADVLVATTEIANIVAARNVGNIVQEAMLDPAIGVTPAERTRTTINQFDTAFNANTRVAENSVIVKDQQRILEGGHQQIAEEHFANAEGYVSFEEYANSPGFPRDGSGTADQATVDFINARKGPLIESRVKVLTKDLQSGTMTFEQGQAFVNGTVNQELKAAYQKALDATPEGKTALRDKLLSPAMKPDGTVDFAKLQKNISTDPHTMGLSKLEQVKLANEFSDLKDKEKHFKAEVKAKESFIDATEAKKQNEADIAKNEKLQITKEKNIKNLKAALKGVLPGAAAGLVVIALLGGGLSPGWMITGGLVGAGIGGGIGVGVSEVFDPKTVDFKIRQLKSEGDAAIRIAQLELSAAQQRARLAETIRNAKDGDIASLEKILNIAQKTK